MQKQIILEIIFLTALYTIYFMLWKIKSIFQKKATGKDPGVAPETNSNVQKYMGALFRLIKIYALIIFIMHALNFQYYSLFSRVDILNSIYYKIIAFIVGLFGLSICLHAQIMMGNSWRVWIDEADKPRLVKAGLYNIIRNPTYLGIFILNFAVWIIWPTWTIFIFNLLFIISTEFQVRCEEDFLERNLGEEYIIYKKNTWRYIPYIY